MRVVFIWVLGLALLANGVFMFLAPATWYGLYPDVVETGPLNLHFVRDIGAAYMVAGGGLLSFAIDVRAGPAALAGACFLALHAMVHLWDAATGRESLRHLAEDVPAIILPAVLVFWTAWPRPRSAKETSDAEMVHAAADRRF
jgi:uncharacterized protein YjeT (DUF2065 family)